MSEPTVEDPTQVTYDKDHPLRIKARDEVWGEEAGKMPHEMSEDDFVAWCILEGMTERGYWVSVGMGESFVEEVRKLKPKRTDQLTADQRGWAMARHPVHFNRQTARWVIDPQRPGVPVPFTTVYLYRDRRQYETRCQCEKPRYSKFGTRWDGVELRQCVKCGEVVEKKAKK